MFKQTLRDTDIINVIRAFQLVVPHGISPGGPWARATKRLKSEGVVLAFRAIPRYFFSKILMGVCSDGPYECAGQI